MHGNIASSRVCVHGNGYFTIPSEWVVSSKMGQRPKLRLTVGYHEKKERKKYNNKSRVYGRSKMG